MFCKKCGKEIESSTKFCRFCGATLDQATTMPEDNAVQVNQPVQPQSVPPVQQEQPTAPIQFVPPVQQEQPTVSQPTHFVPPLQQEQPTAPIQFAQNNKKPLNKKFIGIGACIVAVVILIVIFINVFSSENNNPEEILQNYLQANMNMDYGTLAKYSAFNIDALIKETYEADGLTEKEFYEDLYDEYGVRSVQELFQLKAEENREYIREAYGENYRIMFEIIDDDKFTRKEMRAKIEDFESLFEYYDFDVSKIINLDGITEMVEYEVEMILMVDGEEEDTNTDTFIMVMINGKWRVLDNTLQQTIQYSLEGY